MNYTNQRHGKLTLLSYLKSGGPGVGAIWVALCDCGKTREVLARKVKSGKISTCGHCTSSSNPGPVLQKIPKGHRRSYTKLIKLALEKGSQSNVTIQQYMDICSGRCIVCNANRPTVEWGEPGGPFSSTNLVPLCDLCSEHRRGRSILKWLRWLVGVSQHMNRVIQKGME